MPIATHLVEVPYLEEVRVLVLNDKEAQKGHLKKGEHGKVLYNKLVSEKFNFFKKTAQDKNRAE